MDIYLHDSLSVWTFRRMSNSKKIVLSEHNPENGSLKTYVKGFVLSLVFTISAYLIVVSHTKLRLGIIITIIVALALAQFFTQLYYFLHLGKESKPRWKLFVFWFMVTVVLILVFGSIWIMNNLNTRMTYNQQYNYMNDQGGGF